ncbi:MAG TPA: UrcA family protein [Steroidobacteraceae bacterium]
MNKGLIAFVAAAAGVLAAGTSSAEVVEGVTVEAARVVEVGRTPYGAPEQVVVMRRGVSYSDLNLKTAEGQAAMEVRVKETATALCKELDKMYPLQDAKKADCVRDAVRTAMDEVAKLGKK